MNSSPVSLIRRVRVLGVLTLAAALTTAAFNSTSAASHVGRLLGVASHADAATRPSAHARHSLSSAPALRRALEPAADSPFVTTDQTDYKPGDTVVIFGSGWAAGETVKLVIHEESTSREDKELSADADEYGNILNKEFSPTVENLGSSFTLTATGQSSGRTASTKFTDGGNMTYNQAGFSATVFSGPSSSTSASFTQNITAPAGNGNFRADALVTPTGVSQLPASWVTVTPSSRNFNTGNTNNAHTDSNSWNVNITPPANTPAGVYTATIFAVPNTASVQKGLGTAIQLTVSTDSAPPTTSLSAVDASSNPYSGVNFVSTAKVTITLTATDAGGSGVADTRYKVDNGQFKSYSGPFDIANEGLSVVTYFSVDNTGAQETAHFFTVKIDRTAPSISCGAADGQWHASDVSIPCTATDGGGQQKSGLANSSDASFSLSTNVPANTEDPNASTGSRQVCDAAGNCANAGPVGGNKVDKKAPTFDCAGASANWLGVDAVIPCTASDGGSGTSTTSFSLFTSVPAGTEDSNASTGSQQVCDAVGNCATAGPVTGNKIDKKAPVIACSGDDGSWHGSNVMLNCTATDGGSGLANPSDASFTLTTNVPNGTETSNASTGSHSVSDAVGNSAGAGPVGGIKVDLKAPTVNCDSPDGAWHGSDVGLVCTATDGGSGVNGSSSAALLTSVAAGVEDPNASTDSHVFTDNVGNAATAGPITGNKVDKKAPSANCDSADAAWHGDNVSIPCTASDGGSGLNNPSDAAFSLSTAVADGTEDSNASTGSRQVCDAVNNCSQAGPAGGIKVDRKSPEVSCGSADAVWHASDVSIPCTATDGGSGLANAGDASFSLSTSVPANTEDPNAPTDSRQVCDGVGHCSAAGPVSGNKVDKKPPTVTASAALANNSPYSAGAWTNQSVVVSYQCSDGGSGVASVDGPSTLSAEGANQSATGNCTDNVGNSAHATFSPVNIDKTAPTISASRSPAANGFGWNNTDVTASYTAGDALSGLTDPASGSFTFTTEGSNQSHAFTVHDQAGNTASATVSGVNIDKTAPNVTINAPTAGTYLLNQSVAASYSCGDGGNPPSGVDTCTGPVGNGAAFDTSSVGSHTFNVTAKDKAGNTYSKAVTYGVVYDWSGYLQPINLDGSSVFKLGSTVPVKFQAMCGTTPVSRGCPARRGTSAAAQRVIRRHPPWSV
ncbi:MAG: hypothetical protein M3444_12050 [Acidobacteriota bacterium]|nr:hypothetical protein [Acidobacteriota bacterium]